MAKVTNAFIASILSTEDSSSNVDINRSVNVSFDEDVGTFTTYQTVNGSNTLILPKTVCYQIYVRNLDPAVVLQVHITPVGQVTAIVADLQPGGKDFLLLCMSTGGISGGFSSATVSSTAPCLYEYFIGG